MRIVAIIVMGWLIAAPLQALAAVNIFACEPEWQSLASEIGKEHVKIKTATSAFADPHHIRAKPSLIAAIRKADLVICSGAGLEVGWLPIVLEKGKQQVQPGQTGHLMASDYVKTLEVPTKVDRSMGDVHPEGNPHIHLNPYNMIPVAKELARRLQAIDAPHHQEYQKNLAIFLKKWQQSIPRWEAKARNLKGLPIVTHHKNWTYLIDWLQLKQVATLEPKPGLPPSSRHVQGLLATLANTPAKVIVRTPYEDHKPSQWLSDKTGIPAIKLPYTVGGEKAVTDLFQLFHHTIDQLLGVQQQHG